MSEQVIEQLAQYRQMKARIKVLSEYSIGAGITVSRLNEDDQLQDLHSRLRNMPTYMYLTPKEQQLETTAHAYLTRYPAGTKAQLAAIPVRGADEEDEKMLKEIRAKIQKVIDARGFYVNDLDDVLERVAELQDLQAEVKRIDNIMQALEEYRPDYAKLLKLRYMDGLTPTEVAAKIGVAERTFRTWRIKAEEEFSRLAV